MIIILIIRLKYISYKLVLAMNYKVIEECSCYNYGFGHSFTNHKYEKIVDKNTIETFNYYNDEFNIPYLHNRTSNQDCLCILKIFKRTPSGFKPLYYDRYDRPILED